MIQQIKHHFFEGGPDALVLGREVPLPEMLGVEGVGRAAGIRFLFLG